MSNRVLTATGLAAVGGVSYYLYNAGGDRKLAEKQFEHDAATAARKVKGDWPGQDKEAKKAGEEGIEALRSRAQALANDARTEGQKAEAAVQAYSADAKKKLEELKHDASREVNATANKFDKEVTEGINKSKGWFGGLFGGK